MLAVASIAAVGVLAACAPSDDSTQASAGVPAPEAAASPDPSPSVSDDPLALPVLLVWSGEVDGYGAARVTGDFEVNEHGCVVIGDEVVIAPPGSTVTAEGAVQIVGYAPVAIGDTFDGGGGYAEWPTANELDASLPGAVDCVDAASGPVSVVSIAPAESDAP